MSKSYRHCEHEFREAMSGLASEVRIRLSATEPQAGGFCAPTIHVSLRSAKSGQKLELERVLPESAEAVEALFRGFTTAFKRVLEEESNDASNSGAKSGM